MHISGPLRLAADVFRRRVRRMSLQPPLAVAATSPFPSIRLLASCWSSCSENDTTPLGAFHGSRSVPRPPRHCVSPRCLHIPSHGLSRRLAVGTARDLRRYELAVPCRLSDALLPVAFGLAKTSCQSGSCALSDNRARLPDRAPHRRTAHTNAHARLRPRSPNRPPMARQQSRDARSCP